MNDADIKTLINSAVDAELDGHRAAPPWNPSRLPERRPATRPVARWSAPVLAASVAALLAAGTVMTIDHGQDRRSTPAANSATPTPSISPSLSRSTNPDPGVVNPDYAEAAAGVQEATEVAGVSIEPLSAKEAARLKGSGLLRADAPVMAAEPGKPYSFTMSYLAGPSDDPPAILTLEVGDVASGSCPQPFLAPSGHAYRIRCQVVLRADVTGKATFTAQTVKGTSTMFTSITDPAKNAASPGPSSSTSTSPPDEAARTYSEAAAGAREASEVAGVSVVRVAEVDDTMHKAGFDPGPVVDETYGASDFPKKAVPGKSYRFTVRYIAFSDAPPVAVVWLSFRDFASASCPEPILVRPGHTYLLRCQVTFLAGADGDMWLALRSPTGAQWRRVTRPH